MRKLNFKAKVVSFLLAALLITTLCSCQGEPPELETVKETYVKLIEESYEINEILFGKGLPVYERDGTYATSNGIYLNIPEGYDNYEIITLDSKYQTEDQIKEKALEIYSEDYISSVLDSCFNGFMDEAGEQAVQPKYLSYGGQLMLNSEYQVYITAERRYDFSTMKIVKPSNKNTVNVTLDAIDGEERSEAKLTFVLQDGQWRLDSPTY